MQVEVESDQGEQSVESEGQRRARRDRDEPSEGVAHDQGGEQAEAEPWNAARRTSGCSGGPSRRAATHDREVDPGGEPEDEKGEAEGDRDREHERVGPHPGEDDPEQRDEEGNRCDRGPRDPRPGMGKEPAGQDPQREGNVEERVESHGRGFNRTRPSGRPGLRGSGAGRAARSRPVRGRSRRNSTGTPVSSVMRSR